MLHLILIAVIVMGCLGLLLGLVIGFFAKLFKVESDSRVELVTELLPGANCGGCGKAGCADFAKSIVSGENAPGKCPVSSKEQITAIALALGIDAGEGFKKCAVVRCGGDKYQVARTVNYNGVLDCASASLVAGGPKGCRYGCVGMGSNRDRQQSGTGPHGALCGVRQLRGGLSPGRDRAGSCRQSGACLLQLS